MHVGEGEVSIHRSFSALCSRLHSAASTASLNGGGSEQRWESIVARYVPADAPPRSACWLPPPREGLGEGNLVFEWRPHGQELPSIILSQFSAEPLLSALGWMASRSYITVVHSAGCIFMYSILEYPIWKLYIFVNFAFAWPLKWSHTTTGLWPALNTYQKSTRVVLNQFKMD